MKTIIKLILLVSIFTITSCTTAEEQEAKRKELYFLNEDFILVEKQEEMASSDGTPFKIRTWKLHRVKDSYDSVYIGEIISKVRESNDCGCSDFYITNELWYDKNVGDILHFDFIRKNRFYKIAKIKLETNGLTYAPDYESSTVTIQQDAPLGTSTKSLETERRILEIEREILALERELETLKEK